MRTALFIAALFMAAPAVAEKGEGPCKADAEKFCAGVPHGGGKVIECLKSHHDELSDACKAKQEEVREKVEEFHKDCADDVKKLCGTVKHGKGRIIACLKEHQAETSPACQTALSSKGAPAPGAITPPPLPAPPPPAK